MQAMHYHLVALTNYQISNSPITNQVIHYDSYLKKCQINGLRGNPHWSWCQAGVITSEYETEASFMSWQRLTSLNKTKTPSPLPSLSKACFFISSSVIKQRLGLQVLIFGKEVSLTCTTQKNNKCSSILFSLTLFVKL